MIRRLAAAVLALLLLCAAGGAETMPEWDYPLEPEILEDFQQYITLANRSALLDKTYVPGDLVNTSVKRAAGSGTMQLRQAASDALAAMFSAAEEAGYTLYLKSAYRSYQTQRTMYSNRLEKNHGKDDGLVSYPGASDHQTGLGADILNYAWTQKDGMNKDFALTQEAQWMADHCQEFGFILRYMEDKEHVTGIKFEPWHFRYVGPEAARYIMENHMALEEFTREWQGYVAEYEARGGDFQKLLRERARINDVTVIDISDDGEEELSIFY